MRRCLILTICALTPWLSSCASDGAANSAGPLTPAGAECGIAPPGQCEIVPERTDTQRFEALSELSKQLTNENHYLHDKTLAGGEETHALGDHLMTVAIVMSTWDSERESGKPVATRRTKGGKLYPISERLRCGVDQLIKLGANANPNRLVCWSQEVWRVGHAYVQMGG